MRPALLIAALMAACSPFPRQEAEDAPRLRPQAYYCAAGYQFVVEAGVDHARLTLPNRTLTLRAVRSGSGTRYSDNAATFWNKGQEAILQAPPDIHQVCTTDEAAGPWAKASQSGVDFHASSSEPGWSLDIVGSGRTTLVTAYGQNRYDFATPQPQQSSGQTRYEVNAAGSTIEILIAHRPCRGTNGMPSEATVQGKADGAVFRGCGNWLQVDRDRTSW